jgi:hypothetical protein
MQDSVKVDISDLARKLAANILTKHESHDGRRQEQVELGLAEGYSFEQVFFLSEARAFTSDISLSSENAQMAEMGARILGSVSAFVFGSQVPPRNHLYDVAAMANEYAEIRQELEEQFSGEELKRRLGLLSKAFELSTQIHARDVEVHARDLMSFEYFKMQAHNYTTENRHRMYNPRQLFDAGVFDKVEVRNITNAVANAMRNSIVHFANLARQFVLQNGKVDLSQLGDLNNFLSNSTPAEDGFSFDSLNDVSRIMTQPKTIGRSQTQFDQLAQTISQ